MTNNISNPSPSHYAEPQWQAVLKTTILLKALDNTMQNQKPSQDKQSKKESEINSGTAPVQSAPHSQMTGFFHL